MCYLLLGCESLSLHLNQDVYYHQLLCIVHKNDIHRLPQNGAFILQPPLLLACLEAFAFINSFILALKDKV